jgi:phosphomannomutase
MHFLTNNKHGDGDRLIAVDEKGNIIDGDQIMFVIGQEMHKNQELNNDMIVSTVMSNLGFYKAFYYVSISNFCFIRFDTFVF